MDSTSTDPNQPRRWDDYRSLRAAHPPLFTPHSGDPRSIQLLSSPADAADCTRAVRSSASAAPPEWFRCGVVYEDGYFLGVREPVVFPGGTPGVYARFFSKPLASTPGAMAPLYQGRLVLLDRFRHATRRRCLEIPRGFADPGETALASAMRECEQETGGRVGRAWPLGAVEPDSGFQATCVELFACEMESLGQGDQSEGVQCLREVSLSDARAMVRAREIRDSFTIAAILLLSSEG